MDEREKQEEKNKRIGWLTTIGVQLVLLILFYFIVAWKEPFPPIPEYGIELGFTTSAGAPSTSSPSVEAPEEEETNDVEESTETEEVVQEQPTTTEATDQQPEVVSESESPVKVEESNVEQQEVVEETKEEVDTRAVMNPSETKSEEKSDNPSEGKEEEREVDQRAIYGSQGPNTGDSEGAQLSLAGWKWDSEPKPDDTSDESGTIVFEIIVDERGEIRGIKPIKSTVSPAVQLKYRRAIEKLTFSQTPGSKVPALSTGTITFIIRSR
ncbi:hypothetical protein [Ekhidna sp.]|uniref:hypothetical protein n=1 Tax=Ekhidna sp. TaxID=2608089 RepID=UPI003CCBCC8A